MLTSSPSISLKYSFIQRMKRGLSLEIEKGCDEIFQQFVVGLYEQSLSKSASIIGTEILDEDVETKLV